MCLWVAKGLCPKLLPNASGVLCLAPLCYVDGVRGVYPQLTCGVEGSEFSLSLCLDMGVLILAPLCFGTVFVVNLSLWMFCPVLALVRDEQSTQVTQISFVGKGRSVLIDLFLFNFYLVQPQLLPFALHGARCAFSLALLRMSGCPQRLSEWGRSSDLLCWVKENAHLLPRGSLISIASFLVLGGGSVCRSASICRASLISYLHSTHSLHDWDLSSFCFAY